MLMLDSSFIISLCQTFTGRRESARVGCCAGRMSLDLEQELPHKQWAQLPDLLKCLSLRDFWLGCMTVDRQKCLSNMKWARGTAFISSTTGSPLSWRPTVMGRFLPMFLGFGTLIHQQRSWRFGSVGFTSLQAIKCCTSWWRLHWVAICIVFIWRMQCMETCRPEKWKHTEAKTLRWHKLHRY